jgi:primosomal protein N' (replication factor Y)
LEYSILETRTTVATVAVAAPLDKTLSYKVPDGLREKARVGVRVLVPLGRRKAVGYLLELAEGSPSGLKEMEEVLDAEPLFPPEMVPLFQRAAEYYCHPPGEVIRTALPAGLSGRGEEITILREAVYAPSPRAGAPAGTRQREILEFIRLRGKTPLSVLRTVFNAPHAPLKRLKELGFLEETEQERCRDPFSAQTIVPEAPVVLSSEQAEAVQVLEKSLRESGFCPFLLHGVTGSGKTEVYLRAIETALALGRRALVLVPEIALTPQLVGRFRARFHARGTVIAVLHSGLSDGERYDSWRAIARGDADIVIGARSAVFAPVSGLGILVVDEEHEGSYKQGEGFRYNARDLALLRGQMAGAVVLMGSATPAVTTFHRARTGQIGYLCLAGRVRQRPLPRVELVDLKETPAGTILSPSLLAALQETLAAGEQALLLLNRRGFSPYLLCSACGTTFRCPNCDITLTYHQGRRMLRCHYCDYGESAPTTCPTCGGSAVLPQGAGTERLEEELAALFPGARLARMDRDTTARKGSHQRLVESMMGGEVDILIGTQMVAKGHDFPRVTLVGVINADSTLNFPDFRSGERTFSLLCQVAGWAGRGDRPGRVLIQTYAPDHYALVCAAAHDYDGLYEQETAGRRELAYPPFGFLANLVLAGNDGARVERAAYALAAALLEKAENVEVLGPAPCPLARLRGKSRMQILLKGGGRPPLRRLLAQLSLLQRKVPAGVGLAIDVDPLDML